LRGEKTMRALQIDFSFDEGFLDISGRIKYSVPGRS